MPMGNSIYGEIISNEQKWIELINSGLLNSIYCSQVLKPFYDEKSKIISITYKNTNNELLGQVLNIIDDIIKKLDELYASYRDMKNTDMNELVPLFLVNKMGYNLLNSNAQEETIHRNYR